MAKTKAQKKKIMEDLEKKFNKMKIVVFADYFGLKVKEMQELKKLLKEKGSEYLVAKKTLIKLALKKSGVKDINLDEMDGGLSIVFGYQDELEPVKVITKFSKEHKAFKTSGGILEGKFIDLEKIIELSKLPTKQELISKLLWQIKAPVSGLIGVMKGNLRGLVCVLNSYQRLINK